MTALVLLSGGLDSAVAAALAQAEGHPVALGLFVDYGQRAVAQEQAAALAIGEAMGFEVLVTTLPMLGSITSTALVGEGRDLPRPAKGELEGAAAEAAADAVWVPNRNGLLVNLAAAVAEARGLDAVVVGFNREEAATFPDNGAPFVEALNACLSLSTRGKVTVSAPCLTLDKAELVAAGRAAGAPIDLSWSCYDGGEVPCGTCESCRRRERAFRAMS
jgi:7-cyano-7-deazaguanine synthase